MDYLVSKEFFGQLLKRGAIDSEGQLVYFPRYEYGMVIGRVRISAEKKLPYEIERRGKA